MDKVLAEIARRRELAAKATLSPVPEMEGYFADRDGNIYSTLSRWGEPLRKLTAFADTHGYLKLKIKRDGRLKKTAVHKMVCLVFHGQPEKDQQVRHINGDRLDNRAVNLCWGSVSENALDRQRHGTEAAPRNGRASAHKLRVGAKGVHFDSRRGTWSARIRVNGKTKYLGTFSSESRARAFYGEAAKLAALGVENG